MSTTQKQFNLTNLAELDNGKANLAINHAIQSIVHDVRERPGDSAKRSVIVEIMLKPSLDKDSGTLDTADVQIRIKTKVPVRQTSEYPMLPTSGNTLMFSPASPYDPRQTSLFGDDQAAPVAEEEDDDDDDEVSPI